MVSISVSGQISWEHCVSYALDMRRAPYIFIFWTSFLVIMISSAITMNYFYFASIMWQTTRCIFQTVQYKPIMNCSHLFLFWKYYVANHPLHIFNIPKQKPWKPFKQITNCSHLFLFWKYYVANHPLHISNIPKQTNHELLASIFILKVLCGKPPVTYF
jgi:hypothetical protein